MRSGTTCSDSRKNSHVLNVPWTSIIAFVNNPTTNDDSLALCYPNNLSCSSPPVPFRREPRAGVADSEAGMAGFRVTESACIVDFEHSAILDGRADERMFEMEWESR